LSDEDIRIAIQNATGPKNALFVPEISHRFETHELEHFPHLCMHIDGSGGRFLVRGFGSCGNHDQ